MHKQSSAGFHMVLLEDVHVRFSLSTIFWNIVLQNNLCLDQNWTHIYYAYFLISAS